MQSPNPKNPAWLLDHEKQVYSQHGEDGIIEKILEILPENDKWCVEFGAWDGEYLSNTANLIANAGYSGVLIEGDEARAAALTDKYREQPDIHAVHGFVGWGAEDNLDTILSRTPIPENFDVLSIDIDGNDLHVWERVERYRPKLVIIEFNPTVPIGIEYVQERRMGVSRGCSVAALIALAKRKGYRLVSVIKANALFVDERYFELFGIEDGSERALRLDLSHITHVFFGFDGSIMVTGRDLIPWHGISLTSRIRQLPRLFREYPPGRSSPVRKALFRVYRTGAKLAGRA